MDDNERRASNREKSRRWREKNPGYAAAAVSKWREENPEKVLAQWKRQSARRSAKGPRRRNTTTPCVRCGATDRMPSGPCRPCTVRRAEERKRLYPELVRQLGNERSRRHRARLSPKEKREKNARVNLAKALRGHGLTVEQYEAMVAAQDNRCAICGNEQVGRFGRLAIDHDHQTGAVRGLLCARCNLCLGQFNDDIETMKKAIEYIEKHRSFTVTFAA